MKKNNAAQQWEQEMLAQCTRFSVTEFIGYRHDGKRPYTTSIHDTFDEAAREYRTLKSQGRRVIVYGVTKDNVNVPMKVEE